MLVLQRVADTDAKKIAAYKTISEVWVRDAPALVITYIPQAVIHSAKVNGIVRTAQAVTLSEEYSLAAVRAAFPDNADVQVQTGSVALQKNDTAAARAAFERAHALAPRVLDVAAHLGNEGHARLDVPRERSYDLPSDGSEQEAQAALPAAFVIREHRIYTRLALQHLQ